MGPEPDWWGRGGAGASHPIPVGNAVFHAKCGTHRRTTVAVDRWGVEIRSLHLRLGIRRGTALRPRRDQHTVIHLAGVPVSRETPVRSHSTPPSRHTEHRGALRYRSFSRAPDIPIGVSVGWPPIDGVGSRSSFATLRNDSAYRLSAQLLFHVKRDRGEVVDRKPIVRSGTPRTSGRRYPLRRMSSVNLRPSCPAARD